MLYAFPRLSEHDLLLFRIFGPGLGNLLFPWARARIFAARHGARLLAPTWPQLKIGPWLRCERDRRTYAGLFQVAPDEVSGLERTMALLRRPRLAEVAVTDKDATGCVVEFIDIRDGFLGLLGHADSLREALSKSLREEVRSSVVSLPKGLALHVRLGDQPLQTSGSKYNWRLEAAWFCDIIEKLRAELGTTFDCIIFSDGSNDELEDLMKLPRTTRFTTGYAPADILSLASASALIGSGSTFSYWGHFLGHMPGVWHKELLPPHYQGAPRVYQIDSTLASSGELLHGLEKFLC